MQLTQVLLLLSLTVLYTVLPAGSSQTINLPAGSSQTINLPASSSSQQTINLQPGRRAQFRILSKKSGLYLSVFRSGRLHAHAAGLSESSCSDTHSNASYSRRFVGYSRHLLSLHAYYYTDRNARFFLHDDLEATEKTISLESVKFRGRYLVMDKKRGKLRLDRPTDGNHLFRVLSTANSAYVALKAFNNCLIAFDVHGKLVTGCARSSYSIDTYLHLEPFRFT